MAGQYLVDDLAHPIVRALLEAFDERHHRDPRPQLLGQLGEHPAETVRGNAHDNDVGAVGSLGEVVGRLQRVRELDLVAQVPGVAVAVIDVGSGFLRTHPLQRRPAAGADGGDGGSPRSASEDDDFGIALHRCHGNHPRSVAAA